jgi:hypothetical protein
MTTIVCNRAVGNQLALELADFEEPVELTLTQRAGGLGTSLLRLRPAAGSKNQLVKARFGNMEPELLWAENPPIKGSVVGGDPDFEPFYRLSHVAGNGPMPVPLFKSGPLGRIDKPCASAMSQSFFP